MKNRLDVEMASRGLVKSRSIAQDLIKRGEVVVDGAVVVKPSFEVLPDALIEISNPVRFVSRAGEKLEAALEAWKIDVDGKTVLDIGSSTGGFTDALLQRGAAKVIAVDVGTDQMASPLRDDPRVELHEGTDIRRFSLPSPADAAVADVSFISLSHVLPKAFELISKGGLMIALVKPHFEVGRELAQKRKGVIREESERLAALEGVKKHAKAAGFSVVSSIDSPIEGEGGNREFLLLLKKK